MFDTFGREAEAIRPAAGWVVRDTEHFRFFARSDSVAVHDFEMLAAEAEKSRSGIADALGVGEMLAARERVISTPDADDGTQHEPSSRIAVFLYANRADAGKHAGRHSMGSTSFSATIVDGRGRLSPSVHVVYYNAFSIAVLEHEIAHTVMMLAAFDPSAIDKPLGGAKDLKKAFFDGYHALPAFVSEGVADYGLYYTGFYPAWGLLGSPESLAASLRTEGKLPALDRIVRSDAMMHAREHKAFSLAAATFLRYLAQSRSAESVRQWLLADNGSPVAFKKRFGVDLSEAERGWSGWLQR